MWSRWVGTQDILRAKRLALPSNVFEIYRVLRLQKVAAISSVRVRAIGQRIRGRAAARARGFGISLAGVKIRGIRAGACFSTFSGRGLGITGLRAGSRSRCKPGRAQKTLARSSIRALTLLIYFRSPGLAMVSGARFRGAGVFASRSRGRSPAAREQCA